MLPVAMRTHYENLKVAEDAPGEVIKAAYRKLSKKYHPDTNDGNQESLRVMQTINAAYAVLSDPAQRRDYDAALRRSRQSERETHANKSGPQNRSDTVPTEQKKPPEGGTGSSENTEEKDEHETYLRIAAFLMPVVGLASVGFMMIGDTAGCVLGIVGAGVGIMLNEVVQEVILSVLKLLLLITKLTLLLALIAAIVSFIYIVTKDWIEKKFDSETKGMQSINEFRDVVFESGNESLTEKTTISDASLSLKSGKLDSKANHVAELNGFKEVEFTKIEGERIRFTHKHGAGSMKLDSLPKNLLEKVLKVVPRTDKPTE
jgi:curved DNA-binding protein CbpA